MSEVDYTVSTSLSWRGITMEPSLNYYEYPHLAIPGTGEIGLCLSKPVGHSVLFVHQYADVLRYGGSVVVEMGISNDWKVAHNLALSSIVLLGFGTRRYREVYAGLRRGGPSYAGLGISTLVHASVLSLHPSIQWTSLLGIQLRASRQRPTLVTTGLAVNCSF